MLGVQPSAPTQVFHTIWVIPTDLHLPQQQDMGVLWVYLAFPIYVSCILRHLKQYHMFRQLHCSLYIPRNLGKLFPFSALHCKARDSPISKPHFWLLLLQLLFRKDATSGEGTLG